jgi:hypothetical protein
MEASLALRHAFELPIKYSTENGKTSLRARASSFSSPSERAAPWKTRAIYGEIIYDSSAIPARDEVRNNES